MAEAPIRVKTQSQFGLIAKIVLAAAAVAIAFALLDTRGCDESASGNVQTVKIGGKWFHLEVAADEPTRMKGLGQRDHIEDDGGMLFVFDSMFPRQFPNGSAFVMRDCPTDIDIIYLDANGRVGKMYAMKAEPPRGPDEGAVGSFDNQKYESRLKKYPSVYPIQFAIELKGGTLATLEGKIHEGDKIDFPVEELKKRAK